MITILLIDDHPLFRKGVRQIISDNPNFNVVGEAASGQDGLQLAEALRPNLVLLDINMKGMSGLETLRRLKATDNSARCIMLTVSNSEDDLIEALRAGADGYLLKDMVGRDRAAGIAQ